MAGTTRYITWSGGPSGDYTTDGTADQTEINSALAWANANPGNIIKMRGSGDADNPHIYSITGQIKIGSSTVWTAETGACVRVADGACGSTPANCVFPNGTPVIGQLGSYVTGIEIYGFWITGNCQNQSNKLGYVGDKLQSAGSGVETLIWLRGLSGSQTKAADIKIHNMKFENSFGEAVRIYFAKNVRIYNNTASNHQHEGFMLVEVSGSGNEVHHNTIYGITDGCLRLDNCQNVNIHHNNFFAYSGSDNNGAEKYGHNGMQIANASAHQLYTSGINVHDNYFEGQNLDGIWINDQLKKAGTVAQDVHIHHNKFSNSIAWADWAWWSSGINIGPWGNGVLIEYNTFDGCYANAIQANNAITASATHTAIVRYNNIINTLGKRPGSSRGPAIQGWGILNTVPTKMVIKADANYCTNNLAGDYKGLTPNTISTAYITTALPDGGTEEDDPDPDPVPDDPVIPSPGGVYIPSTASIIDTDFGYVNRADDDFSAYINYIPFDVQRVASTGEKVIGESKSPSLAGSNLTDFDYQGSELELDCISHDMDSLDRVMAAFSRRGRSYLELGGPHKGYFVSGAMPEHGSSFDKAQGDIPEEDFEYRIRFKTEYPYKESTSLTVRDHYCYNSMKFSADDIFAGNIVKNHSFENWDTKQLLEWELIADAADNEWRNVKYSNELNQWCAVAQTGTGNRIMISGPNIVPDVSGNNKHGIHTIPGVTAIETGGLTFDGVDGFVSLPDPGILNTAGWTIYSKFSVSGVTEYRCVYGIGSHTSNTPCLYIIVDSNRKVRVSIRNDSNTLSALTSATAITLGETHEVAVTYDGTTISLYIDGVYDNSLTATYGTVTTTRAAIGEVPRLATLYPFMGDIYSTRVFSEALSGANVPDAGTRTTNLVCGYSNVTTQEPGKFWVTPPWLSQASNCDSNWRGLAWCSEWGRWVATSINGTAGYACITSVDGVTWEAKATPAAADGISWGDVLWIPPNATVTNGRVIVFAYAGTGNRAMYSDDECATWTMVQTASDTTNWIRSAYAPKLNRIVVVAYAGATGQQAMYSDDCGATWTIITTPTPNQQWTGLIWADLLDLFISCSDDGTQQIMTSPTGITWTLRDTPYAYTEKTDGEGEVVGTLADDTNVGWNYTTLATTYTTSVNPMYTFVLPALTNGHIYRLDNFHCQLRAVASGATASMKVTVQAASLYSGVETDIKEWTETATSYRQKSYDSVLESATNETVTIRFYLKSSTGSIRAGATIMGYEASEMTTGGSTIIYHRNQWRDLTYASELNLMVAVCQDTSYNYTMYSANGIVWQKVATIANQAWNSVEYSEDQKTFIAVSSSGTNRIMLSTGYGEMKDIAPTNWTLVETGQERSDEHTIDGTYSIHIEGDGETEEPGYIFQKLPFDSMYDAGEMYIFSAYGYVDGLTEGSFSVDIYAGGTIIKELVWSADTEEPLTKDLQFIFDTIPSNVYIRVRGASTPNAGSHYYLDNVIISKRSEFEQSSVGAEIVTNEYYNVIPNVTVRGVGTATDSGSSNRTISDVDEEEYTNSAITYGTKIKEVVFPALTGGSKYRLDQLSMKIKSSSTAAYTYIKATVQAASLFSGVETDIALYTTNLTTYQTRTYVLPYDLLSATNETFTIRWYVRTSKVGNIASVTYIGYKLTEILDKELTKTTSIHLYNDADTRKIMKCCNILPPGFMVAINKNNTGSYRYTEPFENDNYILNAYEITGAVARNAEDQTLVMPVGSSITFYFDTLYAVAGIPFIKLFTVSGIPQISIADNSGSGGAPGTFYSVDANTSAPVEMTEVVRELDSLANLRLRGKNKYYVKITPLTGASCEFGQMLEYAALDTIDAQRFYIYASEKPNSIGVVVGGTGKCSAVVSLGYRDANILP